MSIFYKIKKIIIKLIYPTITFFKTFKKENLIYLYFFFLLGFIIYKFVLSFNYDTLGLLVFFISTILTSFLISKGIFSKNIFLRVLQITIFYTILISLFNILYITAIVGTEIRLGDSIQCSSKDPDDKYYKLPKNIVDKTLDLGSEVIKSTVENVIPNIGAGAAAGSAASTVLKLSSALPPTQRVILASTTAFAVAAGTQAGLSAGTAAAKNIKINNMIKDSPYSDPNLERAPSPDKKFLIESPLENWEIEPSPLETILISLMSINKNILLLLLILSYFLISRYLLFYKKDLF